MGLYKLNDRGTTFLVWDSVGLPPEGDWVPVLWRGFSEGGSAPTHSIPRRVEEQADALRARFLAWIYDLGEAQIDGRRLVDHLALRPGFSYWWLTLQVEKCYVKSSRLSDAVKLLALEDLIADHSAGKVILASGDKVLARTFHLWCRRSGQIFEWRRLNKLTGRESISRRLYQSLPHGLQAVLYLLRYIYQRWPLRQERKSLKIESGVQVTIVDILTHLDSNAMSTGRYGSNYWTDLIGVLERDVRKVNWLHHYFRHAAVPTTRRARDLINRFNQSSASTHIHTTLDGVLGWRVIRGAVRDYARLVLAGLRVRKARRHFRPIGSNVDLWPLFKQDWHSSMCGTIALSNSLFLNLFERTLKQLPRQELGVYLQENQGWEKALVYAWKAAGHGRLVGVPHSTIRYWDLRYFLDPRSYQRTGENDLPLPDVVALNGPAAIAACRQGSFPKELIVEVEALRYLYLADLPLKQKPAKGERSDSLRVLVLGDYLPSVTHQQMQFLAEAAHLLPPGTCYVVKSHPNCPINASDYPALQMQVTGAPLSDLLPDCDVAFTSNITSAAVDAYGAGIPVLSVLDGGTFNMSPLRGLVGVAYVTSSSELVHALRHALESKERSVEAYFCIDKQLPRWRSVLGLRVPETM